MTHSQRHSRKGPVRSESRRQRSDREEGRARTTRERKKTQRSGGEEARAGDHRCEKEDACAATKNASKKVLTGPDMDEKAVPCETGRRDHWKRKRVVVCLSVLLVRTQVGSCGHYGSGALFDSVGECAPKPLWLLPRSVSLLRCYCACCSVPVQHLELVLSSCAGRWGSGRR